jgi:hypothetical protein
MMSSCVIMAAKYEQRHPIGQGFEIVTTGRKGLPGHFVWLKIVVPVCLRQPNRKLSK